MTVLIVPEQDAEPWPTLGPQVCWWIEENLVHGPGDIRGERIRLNPDQRFALFRMYEVFPSDTRTAGRRRFKRCGISWRKGTAKTEFAAFIAAAELHPEAPVRCAGFDGNGNPIARSVTDPYVPMVAYTEEQSDELAYGALKQILEDSRAGRAFDIGLERILRRDGHGKAVSLAGAPNARDGGRTTFQVFDETHRWVRPNLKHAHRTMLANVPKRFMSDPWSFEITTAFAPGEGSVAESTMDYARAIAAGKVKDPVLFFFHRQASDEHDFTTPEGRRAGVLEASGPYFAEWSDVDAIESEWQDPDADLPYLERVWGNRPVQQASRAFSEKHWKELGKPATVVAGAAKVALGLDGNRDRAAALVAVELESGFVWPLQVWERPINRPDWEVPVSELDGAVADAFERWNVVRMHANPRAFEGQIDMWRGRYGDKRVLETRSDASRRRRTAFAVRTFAAAIQSGELSHSGDRTLGLHVASCNRQSTNLLDDEDRPLWLVRKERDDSPNEIEAAKAAILAWEARGDAIAAGALHQPARGHGIHIPADD